MGHIYQELRLAHGRSIRLGADIAILQVDGREAPATFLVGKVDEPILGVETLEALGLVVDRKSKRLSPSRPYACVWTVTASPPAHSVAASSFSPVLLG